MDKPKIKRIQDGSIELWCEGRFIASWHPGPMDDRRINSMLAEAFDEGMRAKAAQIKKALS